MKTVGLGMYQVCLTDMCKPWIQSPGLTHTKEKLAAHSEGFSAEYISSKSQEKTEIIPTLQRA